MYFCRLRSLLGFKTPQSARPSPAQDSHGLVLFLRLAGAFLASVSFKSGVSWSFSSVTAEHVLPVLARHLHVGAATSSGCVQNTKRHIQLNS